MQDFRNTGFAQPVDSSVVDPQLSGDAEVRLADGRRLDGKVQGGFRPDRAMRLKQADGREVMVQPGDLRTVIWRRVRSPLVENGPGFELRLVDGQVLSGYLISTDARPQGLFLHGDSSGENLLIYLANTAIGGLTMLPGIREAAGSAEPCTAPVRAPGEPLPRTPLRQLNRPGEVIVLRNILNVKHYVEMLAGDQSGRGRSAGPRPGSGYDPQRRRRSGPDRSRASGA